jgi:hypothetical protein
MIVKGRERKHVTEDIRHFVPCKRCEIDRQEAVMEIIKRSPEPLRYAYPGLRGSWQMLRLIADVWKTAYRTGAVDGSAWAGEKRPAHERDERRVER